MKRDTRSIPEPSAFRRSIDRGIDNTVGGSCGFDLDDSSRVLACSHVIYREGSGNPSDLRISPFRRFHVIAHFK